MASYSVSWGLEWPERLGGSQASLTKPLTWASLQVAGLSQTSCGGCLRLEGAFQRNKHSEDSIPRNQVRSCKASLSLAEETRSHMPHSISYQKITKPMDTQWEEYVKPWNLVIRFTEELRDSSSVMTNMCQWYVIYNRKQIFGLWPLFLAHSS